MYGIDPMKVRIVKEREVRRELSLDEEEEALKNEIKKLTVRVANNRPYKSKIVSEDELSSAVEEGWEIVRDLSGGKFLMKRANHA